MLKNHEEIYQVCNIDSDYRKALRENNYVKLIGILAEWDLTINLRFAMEHREFTYIHYGDKY